LIVGNGLGGTFGDNGYGAFAIGRTNFGAHRIAYMLIHGIDSNPENYEVCHTCDNKKCVNPAHLFLGSQQDNMNDKVLKQRQAKGELVGISVLIEKQVIEIIQLLNIESISKIARQFDVHGSTIGLIKSGKTWKHIPRD